jgi:ribonuclease P protein component
MAGGTRPPAVEGRAAGERWLLAERLRRRADFLRCYREGRRRQGGALALYFIPNGLGQPRLGITASRKVGGAVARHRLKRWIREIYRRWTDRKSLPAVDIVVHLKPEAGRLQFETFRLELLRSLSSLAAGERSRQSGRELPSSAPAAGDSSHTGLS